MTTGSAAPRESGEQGFAEASVHEAVDDGVDTGGGVAQQVDKSNRCSGESTGGGAVIKSPPGVDTVQRHPTEKEKDDDDHKHTDDSLLGLQLGL